MKKMRKTKIRNALLVATTAALVSIQAQATEIQVLATGAVSGAFSKLVPLFERETGDTVHLSWGPSFGASKDALPVRIRNGEPVDVVIMVGSALDQQINAGQFVASTRVDLAQSGIGVGVRAGASKPDIRSAQALKATLLNARSIGYSEGASGTYIAGTLLRKLGVADQVSGKTVLVKGKELVGEAVARGDVEVGLQQISELRAVPGVDYVGPLPANLQKSSLISAAIATNSPARISAKAFLAFLSSPESAQALIQSGLDPITSGPGRN
ncbi:ABC transporter substrate-binding protein [Paraburkholderia dipogonis]|uniref:ABC transporter substrate-binding protein n=1 Tax=Paraburkholderia dipogonis TaxID=1211383 RepID=A0A4Y8MXW7_9BURK|nr:ABC transporter substrate-binding protein [Paraburkholderia dipogonis]